MTQAQQSQYERLLAKAAIEGIQIGGKGTCKATGQGVYAVTSSKGGCGYLVIVAGSDLVCNCLAHGLCKHRALVRHTIILAADKARQLAEEQELDRIAHEAATGRDVYDEMPLIQPPQGPRITR